MAKEEEALDAVVFCGGEIARSGNNAGLGTRKTVSSSSLPQISSFEALLLGNPTHRKQLRRSGIGFICVVPRKSWSSASASSSTTSSASASTTASS